MGDGAMVRGRVLIVEDAAGQGETLREYLQALHQSGRTGTTPPAPPHR